MPLSSPPPLETTPEHSPQSAWLLYGYDVVGQLALLTGIGLRLWHPGIKFVGFVSLPGLYLISKSPLLKLQRSDRTWASVVLGVSRILLLLVALGLLAYTILLK